MPRKFMFTREEILNAALDLARAGGLSAVTARTLGKRLGTSSQPIFGYFDSMASVQKAVVEAAAGLYQNCLKEDMASGKYPPYKASGMAYIRFARKEKELFKLLFMSDRTDDEKEKTTDETEMLADLIRCQINISRDDAIMLCIEMRAFVHGIATMIVTGYYDWSEEMCSRTLTDMYQGLKLKFEKQSGSKRA